MWFLNRKVLSIGYGRMVKSLLLPMALLLLISCGGVQTTPPCELNQTGQLNFRNETNTQKVGIWCKITKFTQDLAEGENNLVYCSQMFEIPPGYSWQPVPISKKQIIVKWASGKIKVYETEIKPCSDVNFHFEMKDEL